MTDNTTLAEAQDWLRERVDEGAHCPCCTQFAKIYRRKITSPMARGLIKQYRLARQDYAHSASLVQSETHEFSQLSWWGLIEELEVARDDGGKAGWWRITDTGVAFVCNQIKLPKYARIYDGRVLGLDVDTSVAITEALGTKFNYYELMAGI
jgi:hypothetical protein